MLFAEADMAGSTNLAVIDAYQRHGATWATMRGNRLSEGPEGMHPSAASAQQPIGSKLPVADLMSSPKRLQRLRRQVI